MTDVAAGQRAGYRPRRFGYESGVSGNSDAQVTALRRQVRVLAAGLGLDQSFEIPAEVVRLVEAGETVQAVRTLRQRAPGRLSLVAAKRMVDALASEYRRAKPAS
jgi:hypothetical protein